MQRHWARRLGTIQILYDDTYGCGYDDVDEVIIIYQWTPGVYKCVQNQRLTHIPTTRQEVDQYFYEGVNSDATFPWFVGDEIYEGIKMIVSPFIAHKHFRTRLSRDLVPLIFQFLPAYFRFVDSWIVKTELNW